MTQSTLGLVLQHLHQLAAPPADDPRPDGELLDRFTRHRDEAAFAALLERHGPMVWGVCRRFLRSPHDAEDAFQATFLVLSRKAGAIRRAGSLASYLYGVAYHLALRTRADAARRRAHERRAADMPDTDPLSRMTLQELQQVLHEELQELPEKYRAPLVLCYLEGQTQEQAARQLGWTVRRVKGRLQRGREQLRGRLARRGLALTAGLVATTLAVRPAAAAPPSRLLAATARVALADGAVSPAVAALVDGAGRALVPTRLRLVGLFVLATAVLASAGVLLAGHEPPPPAPAEPHAAAPQAPEKPGDQLTAAGRVLDPDGKPVPGAKLYLSYDTERPGARDVRTTADGGGRFRFTFRKGEVDQPSWKSEPWRSAQIVAVAPGYGPGWAMAGALDKGELTLRLVKDDVPIQGRVVDLQGRPVAGVHVRLATVHATEAEDLAALVQANPDGFRAPGKVLSQPSWVGLRAEVTTDRDGRFRLDGIGRDRLAVLRIDGGGVADAELWALTRAGQPVQVPRERGGEPRAAVTRVHGATFEYVAAPTRTVTGTVRERGTGRPLAGVRVASPPPGPPSPEVSAVTDGQGRYRLVGLPKLAKYHVYVAPAVGTGYLPAGKELADREGLKPLTADFDLTPGVTVRCRLINRETGKPVRGTVQFLPLPDNPILTEEAGKEYQLGYTGSATPDADGVFRFVVPPGGTVVFGNAEGFGAGYLRARLDPADEKAGYRGDFAFGLPVAGFNAYKIVRPGKDERSATCDLELTPGHTLRGTLVDPDGKPLTGVTAFGLTNERNAPTTLEAATFTAVALSPLQPRTLAFYHSGRKLAGYLEARGDERQPVEVRLVPWGTLRGRVLDPDGRPLSGARVLLFLPARKHEVFIKKLLPDQPVTDADGRFEAGGVIPGVKYAVSAGKQDQGTALFGGFEEVTVQPGEHKDLGETRLKARRP